MFIRRSCHGSHLPAFLSALEAGLGALLAMRHLVLGAFVPTRLTNIGAQGANCLFVFAATGHCRRSHGADLRAIHVHSNASPHHLDIWLLKAGSRAVVAGNNASVAGFNARIEFLMIHLILLINLQIKILINL